MASSKAKGVQVLARVRPMLARELAFDNAVEVVSDREVVVFKSDAEFASGYDHVLGELSTQDQVYSKIRDGVTSSIQGYNNTIFAYGQTGTGKTHTMMGPPGIDVSQEAWSSPEQQAALGIIPRAMQELFRELRIAQQRDGTSVQVVALYMEIYNDRLFDLLQPYKKGTNRDPLDVQQRKALLEIREDANGHTYVPNLLCVKVKNAKAVMQLLSRGNRHRAVRHTEMNITSSRSHAILQLVIEQWPNSGKDGKVLRSKVNFVDLAGSERWNKEVDMGYDRVSEMTSINSSLSALASVVAALTDHRQHIPYRDSKLTHLLQDSLGGNCRTTIIATLSPSVDAFEESVSTLKFADRAKAIGNNPVVNTSRDMSSVLALKEKEIQRLRQLLAVYATGQGQAAAGGDQGQDAEGALAQGVPSTAADAEQLLQELENTKRALEMERALRSELEMRLQRASSVGPVGTGQSGAADVAGAEAAASKAHERKGQAPGTFDYLRVITPERSEPSSPTLRHVPPSGDGPGPGAHRDGGRDASPDPFKAVRQRRNMLGLTPPGTGGRSQVTTGHRTSSRDLRSGGIRSSSADRRSASASRGESLDDAIRKIREQIKALSILETANAYRPRAGLRSASAHKAQHPLSANARRARQLQNTYGSPAAQKSAGNMPSTGTGVHAHARPQLGSPTHSQLDPEASSSQSPAHHRYEQVMKQARASLTQGLLQPECSQLPSTTKAGVAQSAARAPSEPSPNVFLDTPPPVQQPQPQLQPNQSYPAPGGWGRSAILQRFNSGPEATTPSSPSTASIALAHPSAEATAAVTALRSASMDAVATAPGTSICTPLSSTASGGWGRSAILGGGGEGGVPLAGTSMQPMSLPAPASSGSNTGTWGRSGLVGPSDQSPINRNNDRNSDLRSSGSKGKLHGGKASPEVQSPVKMDQGSWIYILGSSTSSVKAKALAAAMQQDARFSSGAGS